jgi:hypothetical protein
MSKFDDDFNRLSDKQKNCFTITSEELCAENIECVKTEQIKPWFTGSNIDKHCRPRNMNPNNYKSNEEWNKYASYVNKNALKPFNVILREINPHLSNDLLSELVAFRETFKTVNANIYLGEENFIHFASARSIFPSGNIKELYNMWVAYNKAYDELLRKFKNRSNQTQLGLRGEFNPQELLKNKNKRQLFVVDPEYTYNIPIQLLGLIANKSPQITIDRATSLLKYWSKGIHIDSLLDTVFKKWDDLREIAMRKFNEIEAEYIESFNAMPDKEKETPIYESIIMNLIEYQNAEGHPNAGSIRNRILKYLESIKSEHNHSALLLKLLIHDERYDPEIMQDVSRYLGLEQEQNGGSNDNYYSKYMKYKAKYMLKKLNQQ